MTISIIGFVCLLLLILIRMPIGFAMGIIGFFGFAMLTDWNWNAALSMSSRRVIDTAHEYGLSVIPLFVLMGNFITRSGISKELYQASYAFLGHLRGSQYFDRLSEVAEGGYEGFTFEPVREDADSG